MINKEGSALLYGFIESMLIDIPKAKRQKYMDKYNWMLKNRIIPEVDLSSD